VTNELVNFSAKERGPFGNSLPYLNKMESSSGNNQLLKLNLPGQ